MAVYLMAVHMIEDEEPWAEDEIQAAYADVDAFNTKLVEKGIWVFGGGLYPVEAATVVDASKGGDVLVTDGPFAEAKEQIGGFWVVRAPDLDAALELATEASVACRRPVEVRPFQDDTEE